MLQYFAKYRQATELSNYQLKHLENEKGKLGQHPILLLNQTSIRGFDFETKENNGFMSLVIVSKFRTERDRKQCVGRVGRYGRRCARYQKSDIENFQYAVQSAINKEINRVLEAHKQRQGSVSDFDCFPSSESSPPSEQPEDKSEKDHENEQQKKGGAAGPDDGSKEVVKGGPAEPKVRPKKVVKNDQQQQQLGGAVSDEDEEERADNNEGEL